MSLLERVSRFIDDVLLLPDELRMRLEDAEDALEAGEHQRAERLFDDVLAERPTLARAAVGLCQAREGLGDLTGARAAISVARELEPDDAEVALLAARLALRDGDLEDAVRSARDAQRGFGPEQRDALREACVIHARAERRRSRPDRAARELRKALAAAGSDVALRVELVETLVEANRLAGARAAASGLDPREVDDSSAVRLGLALHRAGADSLAMPWLERGAETGSDTALLLLGQRALAAGRIDEAEQRVRRAVSRGGGPNALATLADVLIAQGRTAEAAEALATAAGVREGEARLDLLRGATRVSPVDAPEELVRHADELDRQAGAAGAPVPDPAAVAARAWAMIARGDAGAAREAVLAAPESGEARLLLARARLAVSEGRARDALEALDRWPASAAATRGASVDRSLAESLRRDALRALWRGPSEEVDLAAAIDAVARFATEHELTEVARRAAALRDELDRPLLLAILGEFNAGKSTFINAFVGADVAPTGILPTTATLNLLRGGAERKVRVVRGDGTTREGEYEELERLLEEAKQASVDHVEIVLPAETLERVWILDTPGTNALDPAHEELAREAARRADAALWVFDAGQAGKGTEGKMLGALVASRRVVIPVLNKLDRLNESQLADVRRVLGQELPQAGLTGEVSAISAKQALKARVNDDEEAFAASGFGDLLSRLEESIFSRARGLKRAACAGRLLETLDTALAAEDRAARDFDARIAELDAAQRPLLDAMPRLTDAVDEAVAHLDAERDRALEAGAREVLAFVQPRRSRFARHGAHREDRAFLADVLDRRLTAAVDAAATRLLAKARGTVVASARGLGLEPVVLEARVRAALAPPLAAHVGYQRGLLAGGALRRFFDEVLPRATLEREALVEALGPAGADPRVELRPALLDALGELVGGLDREREEARAREVRRHEEATATIYGPLRALRGVLAELI